jgi:hypothetical protein
MTGAVTGAMEMSCDGYLISHIISMKIEATLDGVRIFTPDRVPGWWTLETLHTQRGTQESAQQVMRKDLIAIAILYCCSIRTSQTNPFKTSDRYCSRPADSMSSIFHQGERRAQVTSRGMDPAIVNSLSPRPIQQISRRDLHNSVLCISSCAGACRRP